MQSVSAYEIKRRMNELQSQYYRPDEFVRTGVSRRKCEPRREKTL